MSAHEDVRITFFNLGIWSRGGYTNTHYRRPNQFTTYRDVFVQVNDGGEAVRLTGQHGQIRFEGGTADGRDGNTALRCVTLDYDPDPSTTAVDGKHGESTAHTAGVSPAILAPINVEFLAGFSIQKAQQAFFVRLAKAISIRGCWGENIGKFLAASTDSVVSVSGNHLAKCADGSLFGSAGNGWLLSQGTQAVVNWAADNNITGTTDKFTDPTISVNNNFGGVLSTTSSDFRNKFGATGYKTVTVAADGGVALAAHRYAMVSSNADRSIKIGVVKANCAPGETLAIRATGGPITFGGAGTNVSLNGLTELTIPSFGVIILRRIFEIGGSGEYVVDSSPEHFATAVPSNGFYYARGTRIWNSAPSAGGVPGWICTTAGLAGTTAVFKAMPSLSA